MAKLELKGTIHVVSEIETFPGKEAGKEVQKQTIYFYIPAWRDEFGDVRGQDEIWQLAVMGDNIRKLNLTAASEKKKGTATVFLNSNTVKSTDGLKTFYIINAVLNKFEEYVKKEG